MKENKHSKNVLENLVEGTIVNGYRGMWTLFGASPMLGLSEELHKQFQSGNYNRVIELGVMGLLLTGISSLIAYGAYKISSPKYW